MAMKRKMHKHRCDHCGSVWRHTEARKGDVKAHTCPICGRQQWFVYEPDREEDLPKRELAARRRRRVRRNELEEFFTSAVHVSI